MVRAILIACAALAACSEPAEQSAPPAAPADDAAPPAAYRFEGAWAASADMCAEPWAFTADGFATPGEVSCAFDQISEVADGYDIAATCVAQAPPTSNALRVRFSEATGGMIVEGAPSAPIELVRCP